MWKPRLREFKSYVDRHVSEELNSVETRPTSPMAAQLRRFQKNLIVWKLNFGEEIYPLWVGVSEELNSVETEYCESIQSEI